MADYKDTLNLPKTDFPMKADLAAREPKLLQHWQQINLYGMIRKQMAGCPQFILHDGPPYANANIHMGTALNKTLKDIVIKSKTLSGFDSPYVPGWDCHGLPIELNVEKKQGKVGDKLNARQFRQACRDYAITQVTLQKADFERLGILGDWQNPYLTMQSSYEANAVRALAKMVEKGHLHRGQKPVHWCTACGSALAEAEVEYQDKKSPAIYVSFEVEIPRAVKNAFFNACNQKIFIPIWTTTPWTLPANEAISVNPKFIYALVETEGKQFIIAQALVESVMQQCDIKNYKISATILGEELENISCQHPFLDRKVPVILGDHVTIEAGTGCVHTAPAHGQDDYVIGAKYNLPMKNPVNSQSCLIDDVPFFGGLHVFKANEPIIEKLKETGHLLHREVITHSYPHCWRHKTPLIFRATPQWFISMEKENLRTLSLDAIKKVKWIPAWGETRITKMVETRPDWCISRQRAWGIPIAILIHKKTGELHPDILNVMEKAAKLIHQDGIDAWHDCDIHHLINDADEYEKVTDVLDVWFESGVSHACVLAVRKELKVPADLYLEGSDQHRGWFQTSLLTSVAMRDFSAYKSVLTHGYVVDAQGRKMSKSVGNTISPADIVKSFGADVLRLWVMSTDHTDDMSVSDEILKRSVDAYRRIRNTMRFLLSNLSDFDPETDAVDAKNLLALDAWVIARAEKLQAEMIAAFDTYQFSTIYHLINNFCSVELGGFYLDVIKDRQYTCAKTGVARRSSQTALYYLLEAMVRWLAPITSFTAEEIWQHMPGKRNESVFLNTWFTDFPEMKAQDATFWQWLIQIRNDINKVLETYRADGRIGSALEAEVILYGNDDVCEKLKVVGNDLRFLLIVSDVQIINNTKTNSEENVINSTETRPEGCVCVSSDPNLWISVVVSENPKCERCWHRRADVNATPAYEGLCGRCVENISGVGETRHFS
ncbi:MAG: isoleucine--tRNA ligase [Gammaproteobacteria bacterium RIFCSPHIGHO2_12_FULL_38_11]|nr:MAG: isoleucine--tRNA ligase [Gammaproteobacteria bacterium RIFCSPHIGHO2_12_FULL_38_11]